MIKGLYFKLNIDKQPHKDIHDFFEKESKRTGLTKLEILSYMIGLYYYYERRNTKYGVGGMHK